MHKENANQENANGNHNLSSNEDNISQDSRERRNGETNATEFNEITLNDQLQKQQRKLEEEQEKIDSNINTISSIQINGATKSASQASVQPQKLPEYPQSTQNADMLLKAANVSITEKLEKALFNVAPFLKDIFIEFASLLSKIIVGSHGQELISSGLSALRTTSSVIELVMLLCSQEWQTSLQKHAGLSFIELVNEGRLLAHASKDHIVRVANEADFILNRMRADDVKKHADFEQLCAQTALERKEEEVICEHLISAARKRDHYYAVKQRDKILSLITDKQGCWFDSTKSFETYWKLDNWEDDMRRRRRFVKNPKGSSHDEAVLKGNSGAENAQQDAINNKDELHTHLSGSNSNKRFMSEFQAANNSGNSEQLNMSETDLEQEVAGPIHFSTKCKLVCSVTTVSGTLSVTSNEVYFEVDENDAVFKLLSINLLSYADNFHGKF